MTDREEVVRAAARRHGLSRGAVAALWDALERGGGQAQFSHPDLGGMGQWSSGMVQIGDMFDVELKARVAAACGELAPQVEAARTATEASPWQGGKASFGLEPSRRPAPPRTSVPQAGEGLSSRPEVPGQDTWDDIEDRPSRQDRDGFPTTYGPAAASGTQNGMRYAVFPARRRLAVERDGRVIIYDTGHHRISGVAQQQSRGQDIVFTSQDGPVDLDSLSRVEA